MRLFTECFSWEFSGLFVFLSNWVLNLARKMSHLIACLEKIHLRLLWLSGIFGRNLNKLQLHLSCILLNSSFSSFYYHTIPSIQLRLCPVSISHTSCLSYLCCMVLHGRAFHPNTPVPQDCPQDWQRCVGVKARLGSRL